MTQPQILNIPLPPLPSDQQRVETGVVQFEGDWPGIFIRGDQAVHLSLAIRSLLESWVRGVPFDPDSPLDLATKEDIEHWVETLRSCLITTISLK